MINQEPRIGVNGMWKEEVNAVDKKAVEFLHADGTHEILNYYSVVKCIKTQFLQRPRLKYFLYPRPTLASLDRWHLKM